MIANKILKGFKIYANTKFVGTRCVQGKMYPYLSVQNFVTCTCGYLKRLSQVKRFPVWSFIAITTCREGSEGVACKLAYSGVFFQPKLLSGV